jgi:drug/metabolite transporter (DMT)-like permease
VPSTDPSSPAGQRPVSSPAGIAAAVVAVAAWGLGNTLIASVSLPGLVIAFYRLLFASLLYVPALYLQGGRLTRRTFRFAWRGGVAFGADIAAFFVAIRLTSVANATTISALQPLVIMGFAVVMFGERVRPRHVGSAIAATMGVGLVAFGAARTGSGTLGGDLMATVALFLWAWYFIASKQARTHLATFEYMTAMNLVAFLVVAPVALLSGQMSAIGTDLADARYLWILAIVLLPGSGHILINWAHAHTTLVVTSLITLAMPVISAVSAAVFLDQRVSALQAVGIAVVLASLAVVILGESRGPFPVDGPPGAGPAT